MSMKRAFPLLLAALMLAPLAPAATTVAGPGSTAALPFDGSGSLEVTVTVECSDFVSGASDSLSETVTASGPSWLVSDSVTVDFSAQDCIAALAGGSTSPSISQMANLTLTPDATAPGMTPTDVTITAGDATATGSVEVSYKPGYLFTVGEDFPMEVTKDGATFNATAHLFGNARSMAMWQILDKPAFVTISGIPEFQTIQDAELAGDLEKMIPLTITVTPPETGDWEQDTIRFQTWSHFLDDGAMKTDDMIYEWTFTNGGGGSSGGGSKDSPGAGAALSALGLLGAAFVVARRRQ